MLGEKERRKRKGKEVEKRKDWRKYKKEEEKKEEMGTMSPDQDLNPGFPA